MVQFVSSLGRLYFAGGETHAPARGASLAGDRLGARGFRVGALRRGSVRACGAARLAGRLGDDTFRRRARLGDGGRWLVLAFELRHELDGEALEGFEVGNIGLELLELVFIASLDGGPPTLEFLFRPL